MDKSKILKVVEENDIEFIELQFTDIFGILKSTLITPEELDKAFNCELMFDGSSVDGYSRIEESDMYLMPDEATFQVLPWNSKEAIIICDVFIEKGIPFEGCPRTILKKTLKKLKDDNYEVKVGAEGEFFLFNTDENNMPVFDVHDRAGYFDVSPVDNGKVVIKDIVRNLKKMGFTIEAAHHEVAPAQHEIDFQFDEALSTADRFVLFKHVVKNIAAKHGLYATFMPKPLSGENGSAMHCHQSIYKDNVNIFYDGESEDGLSDIAKKYMAGILMHAKGMSAITNPTVNSYKRLEVGYEAPVNIGWSFENRSTLIRVPKSRGNGTRMELRNPDATANAYLLFAIMIEAGYKGIKENLQISKPIDGNIYDMDKEDLINRNIGILPQNLREALEELEKDEFIINVVGEHIYEKFSEEKYIEWKEYGQKVHKWERETYFYKY